MCGASIVWINTDRDDLPAADQPDGEMGELVYSDSEELGSARVSDKSEAAHL